MEYILTASEMKKCDENATKQYGIESMVLMERAALETVRIIIEKFGTDISVGIVAGSGNNGGDGIAIARILREYGVRAEINLVGEPSKCTEQMKKQLDSANKLGIPVHFMLEHVLYDVIVDAMFGVGLTRAVEGKYKKAINAINESKAHVVAVDMPSGINSDDGSVMGVAVKADVTVTYAYKKLGQMLYPGAEYTGEVICVPIGIPQEALENRKNAVVTFETSDLHLPSRNPSGNKGTFGKVFLIAGSRTMGGACQLAAMSAFRIGSGMVRVFTAQENRDSMLKKVPEAIIHTYCDDTTVTLSEEEEMLLIQGLQWADVVAIGPGLSLSLKAKYILKTAMLMNQKTMVIDADALNLIAEDESMLQLLEYNRNNHLSYDVVMTPHLGEFARLIKHPIPEIKKDVLGYCRAFAKKYNVALVCKDARTIVTKRYKLSYLNSSGNCGMATAGSGDVLTGIIAGLIAQGMDSHEAAIMGTYAHGLAGDIAKENSSAYYIMSQDMIQALKYL